MIYYNIDTKTFSKSPVIKNNTQKGALIGAGAGMITGLLSGRHSARKDSLTGWDRVKRQAKHAVIGTAGGSLVGAGIGKGVSIHEDNKNAKKFLDRIGFEGDRKSLYVIHESDGTSRRMTSQELAHLANGGKFKRARPGVQIMHYNKGKSTMLL